jgi:outer membrane protein OmpA-like peptidoglycan-associated protein
VPVLAIAALALLAWILLRSDKPGESGDSAKRAAESAGERTDAFVGEAGEAGESAMPTLVRVELPGGAAIELAEGTMNHELAKFLASANGAKLPRTFVFDHVNFETGSTALTPESGQTVRHLAAILAAYSTVEVRLEGHTDTTGDAVENQKLSMARAQAVEDALVAGGIAEERISTVGYGDTRPAASNGTQEGRAANRRLELVVTKI